jgi:RimK family alpha-L-glutamate ligase
VGHEIAIMTEDPGWHGAQLREAFAARGCRSRFVSLKRCAIDLASSATGLYLPGFESRLPEGVFVRGVPGGSLEEVVFYLDILHGLRDAGVVVYNHGRAIERTVDKGMTSLVLHRAGVSTPPCWVLKNPEQAATVLNAELAAGHQMVAKPLFGAQGRGLRRLRAGDALPKADVYKGIFYLQRFIDSGEGKWHDWRVFVIGGCALAAVRRQGSSWITNVAKGARCQAALPDGEVRHLAEAAVAALRMNYGGVDILRDIKGRPWVIEVNGIPAWRGLQGACNIAVAELLADDFLKFRSKKVATAL